jgi:hypothetical protein
LRFTRLARGANVVYRPLGGLLPVLLALAFAAHAAEVTEMPPALRADLSLGYVGSYRFGGLTEADQSFGRSSLMRHDVVIRGEFAPVAGVAVNVELPITASETLAWKDVYAMTYDPVSSSGTYTSANALAEPPKLEASGLAGVWFGAAFAPFSESYGLAQRVTWRLEGGYRTAGKSFWTVGDSGKRGVSGGGSAWKLAASFSTDRGTASPYLRVETILEGKAVIDVVDEAGTTWATALPIAPASSVEITGGTELLSSSNADTGQRFLIDLHAAFGYVTPADIPSGVMLPDVLDASRGIPVTEGEHLTGRGGVGLIIDINPYFGVELGVDGRYNSPYRIEHVYPVSTSIDSYEVDAHLGVEGRIR